MNRNGSGLFASYHFESTRSYSNPPRRSHRFSRSWNFQRYQNLADFGQSALDRALAHRVDQLRPQGHTKLSPAAHLCQGMRVETAGSLMGSFPPFGVSSIASAPGVVGPMETRSSSDFPLWVNRAAIFSKADRWGIPLSIWLFSWASTLSVATPPITARAYRRLGCSTAPRQRHSGPTRPYRLLELSLTRCSAVDDSDGCAQHRRNLIRPT